MSIIPNNVDPSKDYVTQGVNPPLTSNGLVYNQIYAHTGVIDSLSTTSTNGYSDPNLSITNSPNGLLSFDPTADTVWYSTPNFGGPGSAPVINTYTFSSNTYFNFTSFFVLNVPCYVELGFENNGVWTALPGQSTFIINGGPNIYATDDWFLIEYTAPYTLSSNNIAVRITRQQAVSQYDNSGNYTNVSYPVGIQQFSVKFNIQQVSDVPSSVISGTNTIVSQNALGLVENFSFVNYPTANMFSSASGSLYWKSAPQPVGDAIVYFYAKVSDPSPTTINRLYIDPLYSGCKFNVYYTTQTTSGGTIDPGTFYWSPVPQDFVLRNGIYELPQTSCTYLKFEFTQLVPEAYDLPFDTVNRTINTFPYYIEELYSELELGIVDGSATNYSLINNPNLTTQTQVNNQISPSTIFGLATQTVAGNNNWPSLAALNSSQIDNETTVGVSTASQITDPSISYKLLDQNGSYNGQSYTQFLQRKFNNNSVHVYNQLTIPQIWHESYFVGIKYITAFYENTYDELLSTPNTLLSKNGTNSGFYAQGTNYVQLNPDDIAVSPWFSTIDKFNSFNIAGLTSDWRSFLTQGQPINLDQTLMNNISGSLATMSISGASLNYVTSLGASSVYSVYASGTSYGIKSPAYKSQSNLLSYYDSNFIIPSGSSSPWYGISGTTISLSPIYNTSVSGIVVTGAPYVAAYNFTLPGAYSVSGTTPWTVALGTSALGTIGYAEYTPASGVNYYFLINAEATASGNISLYTQFINPNNNSAISGTLVSGTAISGTSQYSQYVLTGTNYSTGIPSNTIQVVVSGTIPYQLYEFGAYNSPTSIWTSSVDRNNMRVSGVARTYLPNSNNGTYRASLISTDVNGNSYELTYKQYQPNTLPVKTWFDIELESFTGTNYSTFTMQLVQINSAIAETFYVAMLAPFYHPVRYEYTTSSGASITSASGWYPITTGINDPSQFIAIASGSNASGIQVRMTALDQNIYISGVSVVPYYKQSPLYMNLDIDYLGSSFTNETPAHTSISNKPYFQLNKEVHPSIFNINRIAPGINTFYID